MSYSTNPVLDADRHEDAAAANGSTYYAELRAVETSIREAFAQHFAGKPGITLPHLAFVQGSDQVVQQPAREAIRDALDYQDTEDAEHALLQGLVTLEQFRAAIVERYIAVNADDIVWARTGLTAPRKKADVQASMRALGDALAAPFPVFLTQGATA